jgi:hypothetical protein
MVVLRKVRMAPGHHRVTRDLVPRRSEQQSQITQGTHDGHNACDGMLSCHWYVTYIAMLLKSAGAAPICEDPP